MPTLVLTGLPGTGKTRLALEAAAVLARGGEVRVVHTDVLKIVLRELAPGFPTGPGWQGPEAKCRHVHPALAAQAEKARREGILLVVEGTLAAGFAPPDGVIFRLDLDERTRLARIAVKPAAARKALAGADLAGYRAWMAATEAPGTIGLDAARPLGELVAAIVRSLPPPYGERGGASTTPGA